MITREFCILRHPKVPGASFGDRAQCEAYLARDVERFGFPAEEWTIRTLPTCQCCGVAFDFDEDDPPAQCVGDQVRCHRHRDRNPCAIEGCTRTRAAPENGSLGTDQWLCSEHWRRFCPPRSRKRRLYHAYFRKAKRYGWSPSLTASFWRFWDRLVADARRKATEGWIDETEINRIMGWGD